jgi:hypothetical protein
VPGRFGEPLQGLRRWDPATRFETGDSGLHTGHAFRHLGLGETRRGAGAYHRGDHGEFVRKFGAGLDDAIFAPKASWSHCTASSRKRRKHRRTISTSP